MSLIKWEPFEDFDKMFNELAFPIARGVGRDLAIDMYEKDNDVVAEMALPGVDGEKVHVSIEGEYLRVTGSREEVQEQKKKNYYSKEISRGSFERIVRLPVAVERDNVKAEYKDGMLRVTLPKATATNANIVKVEVKK